MFLRCYDNRRKGVTKTCFLLRIVITFVCPSLTIPPCFRFINNNLDFFREHVEYRYQNSRVIAFSMATGCTIASTYVLCNLTRNMQWFKTETIKFYFVYKATILNWFERWYLTSHNPQRTSFIAAVAHSSQVKRNLRWNLNKLKFVASYNHGWSLLRLTCIFNSFVIAGLIILCFVRYFPCPLTYSPVSFPQLNVVLNSRLTLWLEFAVKKWRYFYVA